MDSIYVSYYNDDRAFYGIECKISDTIESFLEKTSLSVEEEQNSDDLSPSVCLKGRILEPGDKLEKYLDDLHYYALFISNDPTKELQINPIYTKLDDYQFKEQIKGEKYLFKAINKQTNQKVIIQFKKITGNDWENDICGYYVNQLINSPGIPKIIGHYFSVDPHTLEKFHQSINIEYNNFYIYEDNFTDFDIQKMFKYNKSQGNDDSNINPTMRSKLIFGVASIMKKIHQKKISFRRLNTNSIKLDKNFEPQIFDFYKSRFVINKTNCVDELPMEIPLYLSPEIFSRDVSDYPGLSVDVYAYAVFIYSLFLKSYNIKMSDGKEIDDKHKRNFKPEYLLKKIASGYRYQRLENIPDHYWEIIEHCWDQNPEHRPSFNEIVDILKDDKYALDEFGVKTNLFELHEYQKRIENC